MRRPRHAWAHPPRRIDARGVKSGYLSRTVTPNPSCTHISFLSVPPLPIHSQHGARRPPVAMARQRITTYAMLPPECRFKLLEEIRARREARIAAGLPPDSPEQQEEEEEQEQEDAEQQALDAAMEDTAPEEEGEADPAPPAAGFGMADAPGEFEVAQAEEAAEQQAILDSIRSEAKVEANLREAQAAEVESDGELKQREAAIHQEAGPSSTTGTEVIYISDEE